MSDEKELGPVEYVVFAFDGNEFNGDIIPALREIKDAGTVRIIDLAVIHKDEDGLATIVEIADFDKEVAAGLELIRGEFSGLLSEEDLLMAADALPSDTTAAAILFEHVWATRFAAAVHDSNGWLVTSVRIPADVVAVARETLIQVAREG